jgi:hypothetical protein
MYRQSGARATPRMVAGFYAERPMQAVPIELNQAQDTPEALAAEIGLSLHVYVGSPYKACGCALRYRLPGMGAKSFSRCDVCIIRVS